MRMDASSVQRIMAQAAASAAAAALTQQRPVRFTPVSEGFPFDPQYEYVEHKFTGVLPLIGRFLKRITVGSVLFVLSAATYLVFFRAIMPKLSVSQTLFFDYTGSHAPSFHSKSHPPRLDYTGALTHSLYGSMYTPRATRGEEHEHEPWALVDLFARHTSWEAVESDVLPDPIAKDRLLVSKRPYFMEIVLILPESEVNRGTGIFGVVTELYSYNGTKLAISRRSARFPHQSPWITVIRKALCLVPLLIGAMEEARTVVVPSFRHYVESPDHSLQYALIKIVQPAAAKTTHPVVEVVGGDLLIGKELGALQETLKVWFYSCFIAGTFIFAGVYMVLWTVACIIWQEVRIRYILEDMDLGDLNLNDDANVDPRGDFEPASEHAANSETEDEASNPEVPRRTGSAMDEEGEELWEDLYFPAAETEDAHPDLVPDDDSS